MNKTIYVRDEDAEVWERARALAGELSPVITSLLKTFVAAKEVETLGFERIVLRYRDRGLPKAQAFMGRWLIPPGTPWTRAVAPPPRGIPQPPARTWPDAALSAASVGNVTSLHQARVVGRVPAPVTQERYALAVTGKNRVVVFLFYGGQDANSEYNSGTLSVYDTFEQANQASPPGLIEDAMRRRGIEVQELDI
jgi:hypothetical protein